MLLLEFIILVSTVNHTGESAIESSRRCLRLFLHIGQTFPSDKEDLFVKCVFFTPGGFGTMTKKSNRGKQKK